MGCAGLVKEVNTFCDVIRGDNIDIMEDIIVDTGDIVGGQTRSDNESYNDNNNIDNTSNHNNNVHSYSFKHFLHLFIISNSIIILHSITMSSVIVLSVGYYGLCLVSIVRQRSLLVAICFY